MATTTNFGWETPDDTDLVKDGAAAMRTLGNSIDTSFVDLKGGTSGQILSKASGTDLDYTWIDQNTGDITGVTAGTGISGGGTSGTVTITNSMATAIDAKGDLIAGTGADAFSRLAVGTNGYVLTADSAEATGIKWAAPSTGALTLVKSQTIGTGVTSVAVTSVFSSTYDNYLIVVNGGVLSANANFALQLGSTTSGYYEWGYYVYPTSSALNGDNGNNVSSFRFMASGSTSGVSGVATLLGPNLAKPTSITYQSMRPANRVYSNFMGVEESTTQHTGFTLLVDSSANATGGTIKVYGYANS